MKKLFITFFSLLFIINSNAKKIEAKNDLADYDLFGKVVKIERNGKLTTDITIRVEKSNIIQYYEDNVNGKWSKVKVDNSFDFTFTTRVGKDNHPTIFTPSNFWGLIKIGTTVGVKFDIQYLRTENDNYTIVNQNDGSHNNAVQVYLFNDYKTTDGQPYHFKACYQNGLAGIELNKKWGFVDKTNKMVIPLIYDNIEWIRKGNCNNSYVFNGLISVKLNDKWGCVDKNGKIIIPMIYDNVSESEVLGLVSVTNEFNKVGILDNKGKIILPVKYDYCRLSQQKKQIFVNEGTKYILFDWSGKLIRFATKKDKDEWIEQESAD